MTQPDSRRPRRAGGHLRAAALCAALALGAIPAQAAATAGDAAPTVDSRLLKLQSLLAELEMYQGPIDGQPSPALSAVLLQVEQSASLPRDDAPSDALIEQLEARVRMLRLTRFLATLGHEQSERTRAALLSQPATRDLVAPSNPGAARPDAQAAPPAGAVFACARAPSAGCLIDAAIEASQAIEEPRLRDWALSEIVKAQARAGDGDAARATIRRIGDARQIVVSLRDLATLRADHHDIEGALATASSIPDALERIDAVLAIAARQLDAGSPDGARDSLDRIGTDVDRLGEPLQRSALGARIASLRWRAGDHAGAEAALAAAQHDADRVPSHDGRGTGLGFVATALAEMNRPADATRLILDDRIADAAPAALAAAAGAAARAGDLPEADRLAALIGEPRFRAVALVQLAAIETHRSEATRAIDRLAEAKRVAQSIGETAWRDYPLSRIAQGYVDLKQPEPAAAATRAIADAATRARLLFVIAHLQAAQGASDATGTAADAEQATEAIVAPLDLCWMLTDVATAFGEDGDRDAARTMLKRAVEVAVSIQEPASRARAFSRVAAIMLEL